MCSTGTVRVAVVRRQGQSRRWCAPTLGLNRVDYDANPPLLFLTQKLVEVLIPVIRKPHERLVGPAFWPFVTLVFLRPLERCLYLNVTGARLLRTEFNQPRFVFSRSRH